MPALKCQHLLFFYQVAFVHAERRDGAHFDVIAGLAGVVVIGLLFGREVFFGYQAVFHCQKLFDVRTFRFLYEDDTAGDRRAGWLPTPI